MVFISLDFTPYRTMMGAVLFGGIILSVIVFVIALSLQGKTKVADYLGITSLVMIVLTAVVGLTYSTLDHSANKANETKATQNIMQKYDVKDVNWKSFETNARADGETPDGKILLSTNNGNEYIFKYEVDPKTSEPTLKNMPIQGGNTADKDASAESLLKAEK